MTPSMDDVRKTTQTVILGDCLEVMRGFEDKSFDLILTDPPYNLKKGFANDDLEPDEFVKWLTPIFNEMARVIKEKHPVIIFFDSGQKLPLFWKALFASNLTFQKGCNFYKPNDVSMPHNRILRTSEVFYICSSTPQLNSEGDSYMHDCLVANYGKMESAGGHPTAKNIEVIRKILHAHSIEGGVVLDPFLGSGTLLSACKQLNRSGVGIEISPEYCEIARQRLNQNILL